MPTCHLINLDKLIKDGLGFFLGIVQNLGSKFLNFGDFRYGSDSCGFP